jgi:endoglycosylceramidase
VINEPWPGLAAATCASPTGCQAFEQGPLATFEDRAIAAIRAGDPRRTAWYEPVVTSQFGPRYWIPHPPDHNVAMSFHDYCLVAAAGIGALCDQLEQLSIQNARARADANGDPLLLTEYGATTDRPTIARMVARADRARIGWMWWHYCGCSDPTTSGPGSTQALIFDLNRPPAGANVDAAKLGLLERPYPQLVAGTPRAWSYDPATRSFGFAYTTARAGGGQAFGARSRTTVFVPRLQYAHGYRVSVTGGRVVSRAGAQLLVIAAARGARSVSVSVSPR